MTGWGHCWRSPRGTPTPARRCSSPRPFGPQPRGDKHAVSETRFLWVDVDRPDGLPALWAFLAERPCHLLVESSAGHAHAYWKLDRPLPATVLIESTGELVEPIERAHLRLIHHLGTGADGKPNVADPACAERSRVMRLAGSVNGKTGAHARILEADLALPAYPIRQLVGDLPDPATYSPAHPSAGTTNADPYKRIGPREYFERLAGIVVPRDGLVNCPAHEDRVPSCSVGTDRKPGVALPRRRLRGTRRDLRPRVGAARRAVGPAAARRGVQACPRVRDRRVRRANRRPRRDGERPTRGKEHTMKDTNGARAATDEHPGAPEVARRFTRAVNAERSRLEGKRAQLLLKREAAQAELGRIDRAVEATDELLGLLTPLLALNGSEPEAADENGTAGAERAAPTADGGDTPAGDRVR